MQQNKTYQPNLNYWSIDPKTNEKIDNTVLDVVEHPVSQTWSLVPKSRSVSSIYKHLNYKVTKKNSILVYNNKTCDFEYELPTNPNTASDYFIFHTPIFKSAPFNTRITLTEGDDKLVFNPSHILGKFIGTMMRLLPAEYYENGKMAIPVEDIIGIIKHEAYLSDVFQSSLQSTIDYFDHPSDLGWIIAVLFNEKADNKLEINYDFLLNTNIGFVTGILDGMIDLHQYRQDGILRANYNISRTTIIDLITYLDGSIIDVRTEESDGHEFIIRLPIELSVRSFSNLPNRAFVHERYIFDGDELMLYNDMDGERSTSFMATVNNNRKFGKLSADTNLHELVNNGFMYAYPLSWFELVESREDEILYDFTMSSAQAQNFCLIGGPLLLNSDGDLLNSSILNTVEAVEASSVLSPNTRKYWKNLNDPTAPIGSISDNAIIGLHTGTSIK
jgi:hypothetical protein